MGMFDTVWIACPRCGTKNEFQSKSGPCLRQNYTVDTCPEDVWQGVDRHSLHTCENCSFQYSVPSTSNKNTENRTDQEILTDAIFTSRGLKDIMLLHLAASQIVNMDAVQVLLRHGADPRYTDQYGDTALDYLAQKQLNHPIVKQLLDPNLSSD